MRYSQRGRGGRRPIRSRDQRISMESGLSHTSRASLQSSSSTNNSLDDFGMRAEIGFETWKRESLVSALKRAGVKIPARVTHEQLVNLAKERFDGRGVRASLPRDQNGNRVRYTSKQGVKYLESPRNDQEGAEAANPRPVSSRHDPDLLAREDTPIFTGNSPNHRLLGTMPPPSSFRSLGSLDEEDLSFAGFSQQMLEMQIQAENDASERRQKRLERAMEEEFTRPSVSKAKETARNYHPLTSDGKKYPLCGTTRHSEFARFGVGVILYFKWLRWLGITFFVLSIVTGPQLYINVESYEGKLFTGIGLFEATGINSISSVGLNRSLVSTTIEIGGKRFVEPFLDCDETCQIDRRWLGTLYTSTNLGAISLFILLTGYLMLFEKREKHRIAKDTISVDEYTLLVRRPPKNCGENALKRFFSELAGEPVLEVHLAQDNGKLINLYIKRGKVIHKLWKAASKVYILRAEAAEAQEIANQARREHDRLSLRRSLEHERAALRRSMERLSQDRSPTGKRQLSIVREEDLEIEFENELESTGGGGRPRSRRHSTDIFSLVRFQDAVTRSAERVGLIHTRLERAISNYDSLYAEYESLNEARRHIKAGKKTMAAFVTFETQVGMLRCLDLFPKNGKSPTIEFQGKPVWIRQAPPPSTILWENYDYPWYGRLCRRITTTFLVLLVVVLAIVVTYFATVGRQVLKREIASSQCFFFPSKNITSIDDFEIVLSDPESPDYNITSEEELDEIEQVYLECACGLVTYSRAAAAALDDSDPCYDFWVDKAPLFGYTFVITLVIGATNFLIRVVLTRLANFEKHLSLVGMEVSLTRRVFFTMLFNTGLVIFLVNYDFGVFGLDTTGYFNLTGYADFVPNWYSDVGVQILLIMTFNIFVPHLFVAMELLYVHCYVRNGRCKKPSSQRQLVEWYTGPIFRLHLRIAHNLMTIFVTLLYGPGLPLLYPLAFIAFFVYYWIDKYLLLRYYRTPPRFDTRIFEQVPTIMMYAIIPNLVFAIWMYSSPGFFWFTEDQGESSALGNAVSILLGTSSTRGRTTLAEFTNRLSLPFIVPTILFLVVYVLLLFFINTFARFETMFKKAVDTILCGFISRHQVSTIFMHPPLKRARKKGFIRGLASYSILQNPTYRTAFGIDESFAKLHKTVGSVQDLTSDQLPTLPVV